MTPQLARALARLYPRTWRERYGDEFTTFLEDRPTTIGTLADVVGSAVLERVRALTESAMETRQSALVVMTCAYLAAVAAGVNFYFSVDDTGLAVAMRANRSLGTSFRLVTNGSFLAAASVAAIAVPVVVTMLRAAIDTSRWSAIGRLTVPVAAAVVTLVWMAAASAWTGGRWVPLPWDVGGSMQSWPAPPDWPSLEVRQPLAAVTFVLLITSLVTSAISVSQAIARTDLSRYPPVWIKATTLLLTSSIVVMAIGVIAWGVFAERYAPADFHARNGGFFSSTNFASWLGSCAVFIAAAGLALNGARMATRSAERRV